MDWKRFLKTACEEDCQNLAVGADAHIGPFVNVPNSPKTDEKLRRSCRWVDVGIDPYVLHTFIKKKGVLAHALWGIWEETYAFSRARVLVVRSQTSLGP